MGTKTCPACYEGAAGKMCPKHTLRFNIPLRLTGAQRSHIQGRMHTALVEETQKLLEEERQWRLRAVYRQLIAERIKPGMTFKLRLPGQPEYEYTVLHNRGNGSGTLECSVVPDKGSRVLVTSEDIDVMRVLMPLIGVR